MDAHARKSKLRQEIRRLRIELPDREFRSARIQESLWEFPALQQAQTILAYVGHRSEVQSQSFIARSLAAGRTVFVPWCESHELRLFRLESLEELHPGSYGISEPSVELRQLPERMGRASELEAVLVPGLAFDRQGGRLGQGKGYYDRLLAEVSNTCVLIGVSYDIQIIEQIPMEQHDVTLDFIVTESQIIRVGQ